MKSINTRIAISENIDVLRITSKEIKQVPIVHKDLRIILEVNITADNNLWITAEYKYLGNGVNIAKFLISKENTRIEVMSVEYAYLTEEDFEYQG